MLATKKRVTARKGIAKQTTQLSILVHTLVHYSMYLEHVCFTSRSRRLASYKMRPSLKTKPRTTNTDKF